MWQPISAILAVGALVGCEQRAPAPEVPPDASSLALDAADASPDSASASPFVVGTWRELPSSPASDEFIIHPDGSYMFVEDGVVESGAWAADDKLLTLTAQQGSVTTTYVATDHRFLYYAMFAVGVTNGAVGTWRGELTVFGIGVTNTLELRADRTSRREKQQDAEPLEIHEGTWTLENDHVVVTEQTPQPHSERLWLLPGVALGAYVYERLQGG
jgi:hypothetical protein